MRLRPTRGPLVCPRHVSCSCIVFHPFSPVGESYLTINSQDWTRYCKRHRNLNGVTVGHAHGWAGPPVSVQVHRRHAPGSTGPNLVLGVQAGLPGTHLGPVDRHGVTVHILIGCRASCTLITQQGRSTTLQEKAAGSSCCARRGNTLPPLHFRPVLGLGIIGNEGMPCAWHSQHLE